MIKSGQLSIITALSIITLCSACTPRIEVMAPSEPIEINMNIKIDHEVRVKVDRELDNVISEKSDLF